jgi:hypothetical protein
LFKNSSIFNAAFRARIHFTAARVRAGLFALSLSVISTTINAAPATSVEIDKGVSWLATQVKPDGTVTAENTSLAQVNQVRCEVGITQSFFNVQGNRPKCEFLALQVTEILARAQSMPFDSWLFDGGLGATPDYETRSVIDTAWGINMNYGFPTDRRVDDSIAYLLTQQTSSGGFSLDGNVESVPLTAFAGAALQTKKALLTKAQQLQLDLAAVWLKQQNSATNYWSNAYQTALVHLFLVTVDINPSRDVAISERLIAEQLPNGSWANDPFITAIVLRALATKSVAVATDSGYKLRVLDSITAAPLAGIYINGYPTDANGRVTVNQGAANNVSITIQKTGYTTQTRATNVVAGVIADLGDILLVPTATNFIISGIVTDAATGAALASVYISDPTRGVGGFTDAQGRFNLAGTSAGALSLQAILGTYQTSTISSSVALGQSYQVDFVLTKTNSATDAIVSGVVIDKAARTPLQNASVSWSSVSGRTGTASTNAAGVYEISSLLPESGTVTVSRSGYSGASLSGVRATKPRTDVNFELNAVATPPTVGAIDGFALDSVTSAPIERVTVRLLNRNTNLEVSNTNTVPSGSFGFSSVTFGSYRTILSKAGYSNAEASFDLLSATPRVTVNATMRRLVSRVTGRVVDAATNQPVSGASVTIGAVSGSTDGSGVFDFAEVAAGTYQLAVTAASYQNGGKSVIIQGLGAQAVGDIALQKVVLTAEIAGTVTDNQTSAPIAGATIKVGDTLSAQTLADGSYVVSSVPIATQQVRIVADGYLPKTSSVNVTEIKRYKADVALEKIADNTVSLTVTSDKAQYPAYTPVVITNTMAVPTAYTATGQIDIAVLDSMGKVVNYVRYEQYPGNYQVNVRASAAAVTLTLNSGNLAPGRYTIESRLYESSNFNASPRAGLAVATTTLEILETKLLESVTTTALPTYANFRAQENTSTRIRLVNASNVTINPVFTVTLKNPSGSVAATRTLSAPLRPDERVRDVDLATGSIFFDAAGSWPVTVTVADSAATVAPTADKIIVVPGIRIDATKEVNPKIITPDSERKIRVDIRIKGEQP